MNDWCLQINGFDKGVIGKKLLADAEHNHTVLAEAYKIAVDNSKCNSRALTSRWIPCSERLPENDKYIMVSFENSSLPDIARYEEDTAGGAFYSRDDDKSYVSYGLFVNAWMQLPKQYKEGINDD